MIKQKLFFAVAVGTVLLFAGCAPKASDHTSGEIAGQAPANQAQDSFSSAQTSPAKNTDKTAAQSGISEDEAMQIALDDAQVSEADLAGARVRLETDDGLLQYEVEFYVGNQEYDYEINANTGAIRSKDTDIENDFGPYAAKDSFVTLDQARQIALARVEGATGEHIHIYAEQDDGRTVYEGSIYYENQEYEFEIDANTGQILSWEEEPVYD